MRRAEVQDTLDNPNSTVMELLNAHEEMGIQFGYLVSAQTHGIQENVEPDLLKILSLLTVIKTRINSICQLI